MLESYDLLKLIISVLISAVLSAVQLPESILAAVPATPAAPVAPSFAVANDGLIRAPEGVSYDYVLNTNTMKFHRPMCRHVKEIFPEHRINTTSSREDIIAHGYVPCKRCKP